MLHQHFNAGARSATQRQAKRETGNGKRENGKRETGNGPSVPGCALFGSTHASHRLAPRSLAGSPLELPD